jgi:hypothetical protein
LVRLQSPHIICCKTQGDRYGGLATGKSIIDLEIYNTIILSFNYSHMSARYDPHHNSSTTICSA